MFLIFKRKQCVRLQHTERKHFIKTMLLLVKLLAVSNWSYGHKEVKPLQYCHQVFTLALSLSFTITSLTILLDNKHTTCTLSFTV